MIFHRKPNVGRRGRLTRKVLLFLALIVSFDVAYAQSQPNCSLTFNANNQLSQQQLAQLQSIPGSQYFTNAGNLISTPGTLGAAASSISATEASTSVVTELIASRRVQEAKVCSAGYENVGGVCQPVRTKVSERRSSPQPKSSSMTSIWGTTPPAPTSQTGRQDLQPTLQTQFEPLPSKSIWSEAVYDYEKRSGLGTPLAPASRTQQTSELLFGGDHTFRNGDTQLVVGALGSLSTIKQTFNSSSNSNQNTIFSVDLSNPTFGAQAYDPALGPVVFDYTIPTNHAFASQEQQTLKGGGGGLTASLTRGGFFSDSLFKADFMDLNRTTVSSDTYATQLTNAIFEQQQNGQDGCINVVKVNNGVPTPITNSQLINPPYTLSGRQTFFSAPLSQATTATNLVLGENLGWHFAIGPSTWVEPFVGGSYNYSVYGSNAAALGLQAGQDLRLQAGARFGITTAVADRGVLTASFAQVIYSDVYIHGYVTNADGLSAGYLLADQGRLRLQSIVSARINLPNGFSFFLQCQARYGSDYFGYGGRVGARYDF